MTVAAAQARLDSMVPAPSTATAGTGVLDLSADVVLTVVGDHPGDRRRLLRAARSILPIPVSASTSGDDDVPLSVTVTDALELESYRLTIDVSGIDIQAGTVTGAINAFHTINQLLPAEALRTRPSDQVIWDLPFCTIADNPRFAWRGILIDVARHFMPKLEVMKHIRVLTSYKINRIQLHLTDDQGWRIDIPEYPRLRAVGAWRHRTELSHGDEQTRFDETPHGGCYSLADLRELADFAADLGAELILEIELPGHTGALLAAYPSLGSPRDLTRQVETTWGVLPNLLSPTDEALAVVEDIIGRVLDAVPGSFLHIGADESLIGQWLTDPEVLDLLDRLNLDGPGDLLERVLNRVASVAADHGRTLITWDEAFAAPGSDATAEHDPMVGDRIVMAWRGTEIARRAAATGRPVVLAPIFPSYLDYAQSKSHDEPPAQGAEITLENVLNWNPVSDRWSTSEQQHLLGIQGQLWTEFVGTPRAADYMLYPRAVALADVAWRAASTAPDSRMAAIIGQLPRLDAAGVEFRPPTGPLPWQQSDRVPEHQRPGQIPVEVAMAVLEQAAIDGRVPTESEFQRAAAAMINSGG